MQDMRRRPRGSRLLVVVALVSLPAGCSCGARWGSLGNHVGDTTGSGGDGGTGDGGGSSDGGGDGGTGSSGGSTTGSTTTDEPACGDGKRDPGEECDDGNSVQGDGCNNDCVLSGTELWTRTLDKAMARGVATDSADNVIVAGSIYVDADEDDTNIWVRKYDAAGDEVWARPNNGGARSGASDVATDSADNVIVVGSAFVPDHAYEFWGRKWDAGGYEIWSLTYGTTNNDGASAVTTDSADNVIVVGSFPVDAFDHDISVRKHDPEANELWMQLYDIGLDEVAMGEGVATDSAGNVVALGWIKVDYESEHIWLRKYDPAGSELWTETDAGGAVVAVSDVATDSADNIVVVGVEHVEEADSNIWVRKYDLAGDELWTRTYDGGDHDYASAVATDSADNVIVVGEVRGVQGDYSSHDIWVRKYDAAGTEMWTRTYDGPAGPDEEKLDVGGDPGTTPDDDSASAVATDTHDNIIVVGICACTPGVRSTMWIRKYTP